MRIKGIFNLHISRVKPLQKPVETEAGNITAAGDTYDHRESIAKTAGIVTVTAFGEPPNFFGLKVCTVRIMRKIQYAVSDH